MGVWRETSVCVCVCVCVCVWRETSVCMWGGGNINGSCLGYCLQFTTGCDLTV